MASVTVYSTAHRWGNASYNNSTDVKVGRTSDNIYYRGRLTFPAIPQNAVIKTMHLILRRIDSYTTHTLSFGASASGTWGAALDFNHVQDVGSGANTKTIDLTSYAALMQRYGAEWYLHIAHGGGSNSYTEFEGDGADAPRLYIEYDEAYVWMYTGGRFVEYAVYQYTAGGFVRVAPCLRSGNQWWIT